MLQCFKSGICDPDVERCNHLMNCSTLQDTVDAALEYERFNKVSRKPRSVCHTVDNVLDGNNVQSMSSLSSSSPKNPVNIDETSLHGVIQSMNESLTQFKEKCILQTLEKLADGQ